MFNSDDGFTLAAPAPSGSANDGFFLDLGESYSAHPITESGWYNIEITGIDGTPSKTGKKMLTVTMQAENERASGVIRAFVGSWSAHLYIGLCNLVGADPAKGGIRPASKLMGATGYAHVKVMTDVNGRTNANVTTIVTREKLVKEGFEVPGFLPLADSANEHSADEEALAA